MGNSEESLISEILGGDVSAYAILVKRYQKPVFNLMVRMTSCEEDALDLTQETLVRAYEKLESFNPSGRFFPWLYTIGLNLARDFLRKSKSVTVMTEKELEGLQNNVSSLGEDADALPEKLDLEQVTNSLQKLPLEYREALILRFHQDMSMKEVAMALGVSTSGAKMRVQRGLLKLRRFLAGGKRSSGENGKQRK
jgi:RNA polymerase sigma-70 factor (ECF subfamily)